MLREKCHTLFVRAAILLILVCGGAGAADAAISIVRPIQGAVFAPGTLIKFYASCNEECEEYIWEFWKIADPTIADSGSGDRLQKSFTVPGEYKAKVTSSECDYDVPPVCVPVVDSSTFVIQEQNYTITITPSAGGAVSGPTGQGDGITACRPADAGTSRCVETYGQLTNNWQGSQFQADIDEGQELLGWEENGVFQPKPILKKHEDTTLEPVIGPAIAFASPAENEAHLQGEELRWRLPVPTEMASKGVWKFSYLDGYGIPASGEGTQDGGERYFDSVLTRAGTVTLQAEVTFGGRTKRWTRTIQVVKPEVTEVSFKNDIPLYHWEFGTVVLNGNSTIEMKPDGTDKKIEDPVWQKYLGTPTLLKNEPAAYIRNSQATINLNVSAATSLANQVTIRVRGQGREKFFYKELFVKNWTFSEGDLTFVSSPLYNSVNYYDSLDIVWQYVAQRLDGTFPSWDQAIWMNATGHRLYTTFAMPVTTESVQDDVTGGMFSKVYDVALEYATGAAQKAKNSKHAYAEGLSQPDAIAAALNAGIAEDVYYNPGVWIPKPLDILTAKTALCWNNADLLRLLANNLGLSAQRHLFWGALPDFPENRQFFTVVEEGKDPQFATFQTTACAHDKAQNGAPFYYHAQTVIGGVYYDPSYGSIQKAGSLYQCPSAELHESTMQWSGEDQLCSSELKYDPTKVPGCSAPTPTPTITPVP